MEHVEEMPISLEEYDIPYDKKPIHTSSNSSPHASNTAPLIFSHGAGGTIQAEAVVNFSDGLAERRPCVCFQGNMNMGSRIKMFKAVIEHSISSSGAEAQSAGALPVLAGRSMGARAAVMTAAECNTNSPSNDNLRVSNCLVLVSYPLVNSKEDIRDQILLGLDSSFSVLFISGDRDTMCDFEKLNEVRKKMQCKTWLITVEGANHGMEMKPKKATRDIGKMTGVIAGAWIEDSNAAATEGRIFWDDEEESARWSDWSANGTMKPINAQSCKLNEPDQRNDLGGATKTASKKAGSKSTQDKEGIDLHDMMAGQQEVKEHPKKPAKSAKRKSATDIGDTSVASRTRSRGKP